MTAPERCIDCGVLVVNRHSLEKARAEAAEPVKSYAAHGLCSTCYTRSRSKTGKARVYAPERCVDCNELVGSYREQIERLRAETGQPVKSYAGHGLCSTCYARHRKRGDFLDGPTLPDGIDRRLHAVFDLDALPYEDPEDRARAAFAHGITATNGHIEKIQTVKRDDGALVITATVHLAQSVTEADLREAMTAGLAAYDRERAYS